MKQASKRLFGLFVRVPVVALVAGCIIIPGAAAQEGMTPEMTVKLRQVGAVSIAPDGRAIAYTLTVPRPIWTDKDGPAWSELHVVDLNSNSRPYITGEVNVSGVQWSPDGKSISFLAKRQGDEHTALYLIPADGGEAAKILEHSTDIAAYDWRPDGQAVAFTAPEDKGKDRKDREKFGFNSEVYEEDWFPVRLWVALRDGEKFKVPEVEGKPYHVPIDGSVSAPVWSPDGRRLAVQVAPTPLVDDSFMNTRWHILDAEQRRLVGAIETDGKIGPIAWSPDSRQIALIAGVDRHDPSPGSLMVVSADGGKPQPLMTDYYGHVNAIEWAGRSGLMYLADQGVWSVLETVSNSGGSPRPVLEKGKYTLYAMDLSARRDTIAFVGDSPNHPREVFVLRRGRSRPERLTDSNPWLAGVRLGQQEVVRYFARDGLELEGILIRPTTEMPEGGYPLLMMVHGGPESHYLNGWLNGYGTPGQVAAARGFASFYANYRGSTGRGVTFAKLSQNDPAGKEFDDLVDAITHLAAQGIVNKSKVGITGASYGGYASAWGATALTEHYAAAVMFVGISDQLLSFALSDIPEELTMVHLLQYPWENMALYRERSPITYFEKARTPILIMHGTADPRVHPANSLALYRMLKTYGKVPVRLVLFPGEPHGNRRTNSRLEYCLRLLQWMEHYLTGPAGDPPPYELDLSAFKKKDE